MRIVVIVGMLAGAAVAAPAQTEAKPTPATIALPRSVGPIRLGMPTQAFTRITQQLPDCTPKQNCGAHEGRAVAFIDTLQAGGGGGGLPAMQQFECAFIRDTLFAFTTPPLDRRYSAMRYRFNALYGAPAREDTTDAGLGEVIWESKVTRLTLYYVRDGSTGTQRPGTATAVEYADVRLLKLAEKDRGDKPWP
jgi:hypothetical protein